MLRVAMGGIASKLCRLQFCRANVLFVVNLTHESHVVQFLSAHKARNTTAPSCPWNGTLQIKLSKHTVYGTI